MFSKSQNAKLKTWFAVKIIAQAAKDHRSLSWAQICPRSDAVIKPRLPKCKTWNHKTTTQKTQWHFQLWKNFTTMALERLAMLLNRKKDKNNLQNYMVLNSIYPKLYQNRTNFLSGRGNENNNPEFRSFISLTFVAFITGKSHHYQTLRYSKHKGCQEQFSISSVSSAGTEPTIFHSCCKKF